MILGNNTPNSFQSGLPIKVKLLHPNAVLPKRAHDTDACYDVVAVSKEDLGNGVICYGLGFSIELPQGTRLDLRPRSSIYKTGLVLSNSIGTGDEGYTGEYKAIFYHVLPHLPAYEIGDRILQIHVEVRTAIHFELTEEVQSGTRGSGGFGSTGTK